MPKTKRKHSPVWRRRRLAFSLHGIVYVMLVMAFTGHLVNLYLNMNYGYEAHHSEQLLGIFVLGGLSLWVHLVWLQHLDQREARQVSRQALQAAYNIPERLLDAAVPQRDLGDVGYEASQTRDRR